MDAIFSTDCARHHRPRSESPAAIDTEISSWIPVAVLHTGETCPHCAVAANQRAQSGTGKPTGQISRRGLDRSWEREPWLAPSAEAAPRLKTANGDGGGRTTGTGNRKNTHQPQATNGRLGTTRSRPPIPAVCQPSATHPDHASYSRSIPHLISPRLCHTISRASTVHSHFLSAL